MAQSAQLDWVNFLVESWYVGPNNVEPKKMTMIPTSGVCMFCRTLKENLNNFALIIF